MVAKVLQRRRHRIALFISDLTYRKWRHLKEEARKSSIEIDFRDDFEIYFLRLIESIMRQIETIRSGKKPASNTLRKRGKKDHGIGV